MLKRAVGRPAGSKNPRRVGQDFASAFGQVVRARRTAAGLSQADLAARCGYRGKEGITKVELGGTPTLPYAVLIALALGVSLDRLVKDTHELMAAGCA